MPSTENRVIIAAFLGVALALAGFFAYETTIGAPEGWGTVLGFVLFGIVGVAAPQLYLARTDASVSPAARMRFTLVVLVFLTLAITPGAVVWAGLTVWGITLTAGAILVAYEFRAGYIAAMRSDEEASASQ